MMSPFERGVSTACLVIVVLSTTAGAQTIALQAEQFRACHDVGHEPMEPIGYYLWGLDHVNEWAEYDLDIDVPAFYSVGIRARGDTGVPTTLRMIFTATGTGNTRQCDITYVGTGMT